METFSVLLDICAGDSTFFFTSLFWLANSNREFPSQRPVTRSFDVFFNMCLNKRLSNNREAGDLRRYRTHYDVTIMTKMTTVLVSAYFTNFMVKLKRKWYFQNWLFATPATLMFNWDSFYSHNSTLIPAWTCNHIFLLWKCAYFEKM